MMSKLPYVVGVDPGAGSVEHDVAGDDRLRGLGLDEERALLLVPEAPIWTQHRIGSPDQQPLSLGTR